MHSSKSLDSWDSSNSSNSLIARIIPTDEIVGIVRVAYSYLSLINGFLCLDFTTTNIRTCITRACIVLGKTSHTGAATHFSFHLQANRNKGERLKPVDEEIETEVLADIDRSSNKAVG